MSEALRTVLKTASAAIRKRVDSEKAQGAAEMDVTIRRLRILEDLIKEQTPNEDPSSSARQAR